MSIGNWDSSSLIMQGGIAYSIFIYDITDEYADIYIVSYSNKWSHFDAAFEYYNSSENKWMEDANIISTNATYLLQNKLYNLSCSSEGYSNVIRWKYIYNNLSYGKKLKIRIRILPRIRSFYSSINGGFVTESYGTNKCDIISSGTNRYCISTNNEGQYICTYNGKDITIYADMNDNTYIYRRDGFGRVFRAFQVNNGNYIICDYDNDIIYSFDSTLSSLLYSVVLTKPYYACYDNFNQTLLVTTREWDGNKHKIYEITWAEQDHGNIVWECPYNIIEPMSAVYGNNNDEILVCDITDNKISIISKTDNSIEHIYKYELGDNDQSVGELSNFNYPFISYKLYDGKICLIEQYGRRINFEVTESSSSSSSSGI